MIRKGTHSSALIDVQGEMQFPQTTILEPFAAIFIGKEGTLIFGEKNILYPHCSIRIDQGWMKTGDEVSFGPSCHIYEPRGGLTIGHNCLLAGGTMICGVHHGMQDIDIPMRHQISESAPIIIGDDVWIGMRSVIMPGVTIGKGAVIGAGSIVTKDIPPFCIAIGSPCVVQRSRKEKK